MIIIFIRINFYVNNFLKYKWRNFYFYFYQINILNVYFIVSLIFMLFYMIFMTIEKWETLCIRLFYSFIYFCFPRKINYAK